MSKSKTYLVELTMVQKVFQCLIRPLINLALCQVKIAIDRPAIEAFLSWSCAAILFLDAPENSLQGVVAIHAEQEVEEQGLLILDLVSASWTGMAKAPVW